MNRNFLIGIKKFNKNSEGNKMGVIEFFENPAIKNIFSLMMKLFINQRIISGLPVETEVCVLGSETPGAAAAGCREA